MQEEKEVRAAAKINSVFCSHCVRTHTIGIQIHNQGPALLLIGLDMSRKRGLHRKLINTKHFTPHPNRSILTFTTCTRFLYL
jgi:hypothetical protein